MKHSQSALREQLMEQIEQERLSPGRGIVAGCILVLIALTVLVGAALHWGTR